MSHGKRRKETDCLNCGSELYGPYCHFCGQENLQPKETVLGLVSHFVYDITHFDGKFFSSMKYLLLKPGFLTREYMRGRRASYLNPIRMYVFTSAFFFILVFSLTKGESDLLTDNNVEEKLVKERQELMKQISTAKDTVVLQKLKSQLNENDSDLVLLEATGVIEKSPYLSDSVRQRLKPGMPKLNVTSLGLKLRKTVEEYDSAQAALPKEKRDGWLKHYIARKTIQVNAKYHDRPGEFKEHFIEKFLHSLPKLMFISLPLVALFLWLLYIRQKRFYYVNHGIHIIQIYIALYLIILIGYFFSWLASLSGWSIFSWIKIGIVLYGFYYVYKSMRVFYEQSRIKTFIKYLVFLFASLLLFSFLAVIFVMNSLLNL